MNSYFYGIQMRYNLHHPESMCDLDGFFEVHVTAVRLGPLKFSLRATINHHGPSIHSGHYTASINCCKKPILLQRSHNYGVWSYWQQKLLYCICCTIWIGWHMIFGLEQEGGSLTAPMALAHPLHPIDNRSSNRRRNMWVGWCVSSWWPLFPSRSSVLIYIYIYICIFYMSYVIGRVYTCNRSVSIGEAAPHHIL